MDGSPLTWLLNGEFPTDSPENSSGWPWVDSPTDTGWYHHEPVDRVSYEGYIAIAVYLTFVGFAAIIGNIVAIRVFVTEKEFRKKEHNILLLNLAVSDLGISLFAHFYTIISGYAGRWVLGLLGCTLYGFLCFTFSLNSMVTLCAISIYRYIIICKPKHAHLLTQRMTVHLIIGIWLYVLIFTVPPLVGVSRYTYEPTQITCSLDWNVQYPGESVYIGLTLTFGYVLKVLIMAFCYFNILCKSASLKFAALASDKAKKAVKREMRKTTMMCLAMVVSFLIAWTPYAVTAAWTILSEDDLPVIAITLPTVFAKTSCMMNPIIYCCCSSSFLEAGMKSFRRLCCFKTPQVVPRKDVEYNVEPADDGFHMEAVPRRLVWTSPTMSNNP